MIPEGKSLLKAQRLRRGNLRLSWALFVPPAAVQGRKVPDAAAVAVAGQLPEPPQARRTARIRPMMPARQLAWSAAGKLPSPMGAG
jgi:hypothetical protein